MENKIKKVLCLMVILGLIMGIADMAFGYSYKYVKNGKTTQPRMQCFYKYYCSSYYGYCYVKRICYYP